MKKMLLLFFAFSLALAHAANDVIYVNNRTGDDRNSGTTPSAALATLDAGIKRLRASFRLELAPTGLPYTRKYGAPMQIITVGGTWEKPLVVEGNGAVISGLAPVPVTLWKPEKNALYSIPFDPGCNMYRRDTRTNFWLDLPKIWWVDGKNAPNCRSEAELAATPGGFWWQKNARRLWFHLPEKSQFKNLKIEIPGNTGFFVCSDHVEIRNCVYIFSLGDAFDSAGGGHNIRYRNCIAVDNCGQGFSFHDNSHTNVEDSAAVRCASAGVCDVHWSGSNYKRCVFYDNTYEAGVYAENESGHIFSSCIIAGNHPAEQIRQGGVSRMVFDNCLIEGRGDDRPLLRIENGLAAFRNCTLRNAASFTALRPGGGRLHLDNCLISGIGRVLFELPAGAGGEERLLGRGNCYAAVPADTKLFARDINSRIVPVPPAKDSPCMLPDRYGRVRRSGAELPVKVIELYERMRRIRATPAGIFFTPADNRGENAL